MALSPEEKEFLSLLRTRMESGPPPTLDEMKRAIILLRESRTKAIAAASASKAASKPRASRSAPTAAAVENALADLDSL